MGRTQAGSTERLLQFCLGYFVFYVVYGVSVKYFQGSPAQGLPGMNGMQYLVYSTAGGSVIALFVCLGLGWVRLRSNGMVRWGPLRFPSELVYIVTSGVLTAVIIPTTTLLYSLPISVMVAMVIMRGAIIVVSRCVDAVQIRQGLLRKRVYLEENVAVLFALLAVGTKLLLTPDWTAGLLHWMGTADAAPAATAAPAGAFEFLRSPAAVTILATYIVAYALRIYIMNYYKNTRAPGVPQDNKGFFAVEQMSAFATLVVATAVLLVIPEPRSTGFGSAGSAGATIGHPVALFQQAIRAPRPDWLAAAIAGSSFGIVAIFSVFLFLFQGRTATFAGLVNRLTSLVAGTVATLVFHFVFGGPGPSAEDWLALGFILIAVTCLARAERKRTREIAARVPA